MTSLSMLSNNRSLSQCPTRATERVQIMLRAALHTLGVRREADAVCARLSSSHPVEKKSEADCFQSRTADEACVAVRIEPSRGTQHPPHSPPRLSVSLSLKRSRWFEAPLGVQFFGCTASV
ncbi:hypothetical protein EYF80_004747 [Liparis tanakae]|uniref:Uncharacterized protein n=1 Tax=Liparis tanakae TaxID=230148 RepID=A0A4Z2J6B6_9TELE|nr:hypothetical protein EYF80_004747 [Liparis tanakae]